MSDSEGARRVEAVNHGDMTNVDVEGAADYTVAIDHNAAPPKLLIHADEDAEEPTHIVTLPADDATAYGADASYTRPVRRPRDTVDVPVNALATLADHARDEIARQVSKSDYMAELEGAVGQANDALNHGGGSG
jgi:hypothetical protein